MAFNNVFPACVILATALVASPKVHFDVISIRPSPAAMTARDVRFHFYGDRFEAKGVTVGDVLDMLKGFQLLRVIGGPDWLRTDRFDIEARADGPVHAGDRNDAVMGLLQEPDRQSWHLCCVYGHPRRHTACVAAGRGPRRSDPAAGGFFGYPYIK